MTRLHDRLVLNLRFSSLCALSILFVTLALSTYSFGAQFVERTPLNSGIPLGGLGAGSVELRADGKFHEWIMFNNWPFGMVSADPNIAPEDAFFAVRVKQGDGSPVVRMLQIRGGTKEFKAYDAYWISMYCAPYLKCVPEIRYTGEFPFARLEYVDPDLPVRISLEAFSSFIPHDAKNSGLPVAAFIFTAKNPGTQPCEVSLLSSLKNNAAYDFAKRTGVNAVFKSGNLTGVQLSAEGVPTDHQTLGTMTLASMTPGTTYVAGWRNIQAYSFWDSFRKTGMLPNDETQKPPAGAAYYRGYEITWNAALSNRLTLAPGEEKKAIFLISWHFPNSLDGADKQQGHMYANWFRDSRDAATYFADNFDRLYRKTKEFHDCTYDSTLEYWLVDAINSQLSTQFKSNWWTQDGRFGNWSGLARPGGTGMHCVDADYYGCSFIVSQFFHDLEQETQRLTAHAQNKEGMIPMNFSLNRVVPGSKTAASVLSTDQPDDKYIYIDVNLQFTGQVCRDYLWTGDRAFLSEMWPYVKRAMAAAEAEDKDGNGIPDTQGTNQTYDGWDLRGTSAYVGSLWLMCLRACERMARVQGEDALAEEFSAKFQRCAETYQKELWNGSYFSLYHEPKKGETNPGIMTDQLNGQWYARLLGLGYLVPPERVRSALTQVHKHCLNPEWGLLNGVWLDGREVRPGQQYSTPWTGTEYAAASFMIMEGLVKEGLEVAKNVYDRYDRAGMTWNHIEWGEHYTRSQAAWTILLAAQGLMYDAPAGTIGFAPRIGPDKFRSVFVLPSAWGVFSQNRSGKSQKDSIVVRSGALELKRIAVDLPAGADVRTASIKADVNGQVVQVSPEVLDVKVVAVVQDDVIKLGEGDTVNLTVEWN